MELQPKEVQGEQGYWDGYITVPIHKGPLVYREKTSGNGKVGCVGIGTDEPQAKLHVKSPSGVDGLKVDGNTAIRGKLSITDTSTLTGKVGIGIAPGTEQLKVQGDTAIAGNLSVTGDIRAGNSDIYFTKTNHNHIGIGNTNGYAAIENAENYDALMILGRAGTSKGRNVKLWDYLQVNGGMDITDSLGIGTTNPEGNKLKVQGNTASAGNLSVTNGRLGIGSSDFSKEPLVIRAQGRQEGLIAFEDPNGNKKWHIEQNYGGNTPGLNFVETGVKDFRFFIQRGGNVGIGRSKPQVKLHIKQENHNQGIRLDAHGRDSFFNIAYESNGNIHFYHKGGKGQWMDPNGGDWHRNSDISLKENIMSLHETLDKLMQLNPVRFIWKDNGKSDIGFIAQEVEEIFPEIVSSVTIKHESEQEIKGIPYAHFGVIAIAAIKEMKEYYDRKIQILEEKLQKESHS